MTWPLVLAQAADLADAVKAGGPFAVGAGAVLLAGRLGWIRFPPSPEQTADKARYEALTDDLIKGQGAALTDAIFAINESVKVAETSNATMARNETAAAVTATELARLSNAAAGIAAALAKEPR